jgi:FAD:protein FMN transferase
MRIYNLLYLFSIILLFSCNNSVNTSQLYIYVTGETMGTTYNIKYKGKENFQKEIDVELKRINNEVSTYIPSSTISKFNASSSGIFVDSTDFYINLVKALDVYKLSNGYYDVTVMPLVNYWGFGYTGHQDVEKIDSNEIKELLKEVGSDMISIVPKGKNNFLIQKSNKEVQLDFSSLAKGYGVDKIGKLLAKKGINDYMVEIGGEVVSSGKSPRGTEWVIGINTPSENASPQDVIIEVEISGKAVATSGNYRNYHENSGKKYGHTINPKTGFPERSNLLSASIIANDCMTADALATACMASGLEKSKELIKKLNNIEACFIYTNDNDEFQVYKTTGFDKN